MSVVLLWDVDGTLISSGRAGRRALEAALRELFGAPSTRQEWLDFSLAGMTDRAIVRRSLQGVVPPSAAVVDRLLERYLQVLPAEVEGAADYRVLPGVRAMISRAARQPRFALGLGTGNIEQAAMIKLARGGLDGCFTFGGFGCDHEQRSELLRIGAARGAARLGCSVDSCRVVVIGDTTRDVAAARAIGAQCIAVATGGTSAQSLREAGADLVCETLEDPAAVTWIR